MKLGNELAAAVRRAETLLTERARAQAALAKAQLDFRAALAQHAVAESKLGLAIGRAAVDDTGDPAAERGAVAEALQTVTKVGERVAGLRAMLAQDAPLRAAADELAPQVVLFAEQAVEEFLPELEKGAASWSKLLAKKAALEGVLGLTIPTPVFEPEKYTVPPETVRPGAAANGLQGALDCIEQGKREVAIWARRRHDAPPTAAQYRVIRNFASGTKSFTAGQIVAGSELELGEAQVYVERRSLTPLTS